MTLYTIAYNGYGKFLPEWCKNAVNQTTKPSKIIIVLGRNHGADKEILKKIIGKIPYGIIESEALTMGALRNEAVKKIEGWSLYFSADDTLLPNAIQEIYKYKSFDAVALRYIERKLDGKECLRESAIIKEPLKWCKQSVPAYIAVKEPTLFEEIEIPNYPFLFKLASQGCKTALTHEPCAIYIRREGSHGHNALKNGQWQEYKKIINAYAEIYNNKMKGGNQ